MRLWRCSILFEIKGKVAVVTGSGRGIGKAIALRLAKEGVRVVVNAKKGFNDVESTVQEIKNLGGDAESILADVSTRSGCMTLVKKALERFGSLDILVNNAGIGLYAPFLEQDDSMIEKILSTSLKSVIYCSQEAARVMEEGVIINIASIAGIMPMKGLSIYSASKAAIINLTKSLALELGPRIRVNSVAPGVVRTKMGESLLKVLGISEEEFVKSYTLLRRLVDPEEVAEAVLFLVRSPSITGSVIVIDSGQSLLGGASLSSLERLKSVH